MVTSKITYNRGVTVIFLNILIKFSKKSNSSSAITESAHKIFILKNFPLIYT